MTIRAWFHASEDCSAIKYEDKEYATFGFGMHLTINLGCIWDTLVDYMKTKFYIIQQYAKQNKMKAS